MTRKYTVTPNRIVPWDLTDSMDKNIRAAIYEFFVPDDARKYEILSERFKLDNKKGLTLEEIGILNGGLSRQRIQQIESTALKQLRNLFETGVSKRTALAPIVLESVQAFIKSLDVLRPASKHQIVRQHAINFFNGVDFNDALLGLLLKMFAFNSISFDRDEPVWIFSPVDTKRIEKVIELASKYLNEHHEARTWQDIMLNIAKKNRQAKYQPEEIKLALSFAPEIEITHDGTYQLKFSRLSAVEDRIYRGLYQLSIKPIEFDDIVKITNQAAINSGLNPHSPSVIGGALSRDTRFQPIGRSGLWVLTSWNYAPEKRHSIKDLIERTLLRAGRALTFKEIYDEITQLRSVDVKNLRSELANSPHRFVRLKDKRFDLRSRVDPLHIATRVVRKRSGLTAIKIAFEIEQVFNDASISQMKLADLHKELCKRLTSNTSTQVWSMLLKKNPAIRVTGKRGSQIAEFKSDFRNDIAAIDIASNGERGIFIQRNIREVLLEKSTLSLKELRSIVATRCHITPRHVFAHFKRMKDVVTTKDAGGTVYCSIKLDVPVEYQDSLKLILDTVVLNEVIRGISNLTIDNVDLGLFILGRAFDEMTKLYFLELAKRGLLHSKTGPISSSDAADVNKYRLANRIDIFISNGFLENKDALTTLRLQRNDPAHQMAPLIRRQEMMITASTYAKWYIEYIALFEQKIRALP